MILILSTQLTLHTNKVRDRLQLTDSRTLDTGLTFWCTRPVVYQPHDVAGELFETQIFVSPLRRLRVCVLNIGSDRKLGKRQISISKQMYHTVTLLMEIINISSLDFYFGQSTRLFISSRTRVKKLGAAPRGLQTFEHHLI
jgi:hypothetical protein